MDKSTRYTYRPEPDSQQRPSWWRPFWEVVDTTSGRVLYRYRASGSAWSTANALNDGRAIPEETSAERWAWSS